ncbi:MAG: M48 family metallopeptidase [Ardenticatenales bacterium]|nr:M48 family metallopeptidase [Ardenticatenales bacterium]
MGQEPTSVRNQRLARCLRHRWERPVFWLTLLPLVAWLVMVGTGSAGWLLFLLGGAWARLYFHLYQQHTRLLAHGVQVSATQLPQIHDALERCASYLPLSYPVDLMVVPGLELQAFTFGMGRQHTIVISSALVEALDEEELLAVISHEWGHIALDHTMLGSLFGVLTQATLAARHAQPLLARTPFATASRLRPWHLLLQTLMTLLVPLFFLAHRRLAEFSADRVALLIVGNPAPLARALTKLVVGPTLAASLDEASLIQQAEAVTRNPLGFWYLLGSDHPFVGARLRALHDWYASPAYQMLVPPSHIGSPMAPPAKGNLL